MEPLKGGELAVATPNVWLVIPVLDGTPEDANCESLEPVLRASVLLAAKPEDFQRKFPGCIGHLTRPDNGVAAGFVARLVAFISKPLPGTVMVT